MANVAQPDGSGRMSATIAMARRRQFGGIWIAIGPVIYFVYGQFQSRLRPK